MHVSARLTPLPDPDPAREYVVRLWRPGAHELEGWRQETWTLSGLASVQDAITWARERGDEDPAEVLFMDGSGAAVRLWGAEPREVSTTISIPLTQG